MKSLEGFFDDFWKIVYMSRIEGGHLMKSWKIHLGVSKNDQKWWYPKMDGENNGKPYF